LSKKAGRANKIEERYHDLEEKEAESFLEEVIEEKKIVNNLLCPRCKKELILIIDSVKIRVYECSSEVCEYRCSRRVK